MSLLAQCFCLNQFVCVLFCPRWFCRWKVFVDEDIMQYADKVAVREAEMSNKLVKKTSFVSY